MVRRSRTPQGVRGLKHHGRGPDFRILQSHSARSAWIETLMAFKGGLGWRGRTPQGVRGLKPGPCLHVTVTTRRTPQGVRGLKRHGKHQVRRGLRRTPQGVRGLKQVKKGGNYIYESRTPQGVRGLKQTQKENALLFPPSHSARSAWIET